jgi:hypothetical protein
MKSPTVGHPRLTYQGAKELYDNWDKLNPSQRAEIGAKTGVGALFLAKGMAEGGIQTCVSYEYSRPVEVQWIDCGLKCSSLCVLPERPTANFTYESPERHRDPVPEDEGFLRACGIRPPEVRDELRVLDR